MGFDKYYEARALVQDFLTKDLFGPVKEDEILEDEPLKYYVLGRLFPYETEHEVLDTLNDDLEDIQEAYDASISLSNAYCPSSMAVTVTIRDNVEKIHVKIGGAQYKPIEHKTTYMKKIKKDVNDSELDEDEQYEPKTLVDYTWQRVPFEFSETIEIGYKNGVMVHAVKDMLELQVYVHKVFDNGARIVTFSLVNRNKNNKSALINNTNSFFQPQMELRAADEVSVPFIEKRMNIEVSEDKEIKLFNMLYSHIGNYAVGHGCSVLWTQKDDGASAVRSTFLPEYELKQMRPATKIKTPVFNMSYIVGSSKDEVCDELGKFIDSYGRWISEQEAMKQKLHSDFHAVASQNLDYCRETRKRLMDSVEWLRKDDTVYEAFILANKAMLKQREQSLLKEKKPFDANKVAWHPFQLAFILQEMPAIIDPTSEYRSKVDLLWFPTGGGKTEAYLGLAAFTIFLRRLRNEKNAGGVTILMRYTLRLLTMQQFERAATLICACEDLRKKLKIGNEEISIGLWVGGGLTPNNHKQTEDNLKKVKKGENVTEGNPCQILVCPWCGAEITPDQYKLDNNRLTIKCSDSQCKFKNGLPLYLVDEDIYKYKPTLVVGTVDKFARMVWEPSVGSIFGIGTAYKAPELIIQDELHLISGPLGTITGIYEMAIRKFCETNNIDAKVIASTATIRKAENQIRALYGRDFRQFPPQGINMRDSYFAEESTRDSKPARMYLGCLASGTSATTTLVRIYACLLYATRYLKDKGFDDEIIDSYWSITGYFNSLRELGGAVVQVIDDVQDRFKYLYTTKFAEICPEFSMRKKYDWCQELTSRKSNMEISEIIQKELKVKYPSKGAFDFILASNMISVGVDVGRLGVMVVTGQPKTNAEYIQASSRVGRENPGLVITQYNPTHSRDRSHFEQFEYYHSSIYKFVEATSVTPFSDRARDKALHAVYISLCRQLIDELRNNEDASEFDLGIDQLQEIEEYMLDYVASVDPKELEDVKESLNSIKDNWLVNVDDNLIYNSWTKDKGKPLLKNGEDEYGVFLTLNSMRNVDSQSNVYLLEG